MKPIEIYLHRKRDYRWRIRSNNGRIIASSGEGFTTNGKCRDNVQRLFNYFRSIDPAFDGRWQSLEDGQFRDRTKKN